jgi:hypothetical protein
LLHLDHSGQVIGIRHGKKDPWQYVINIHSGSERRPFAAQAPS